MKNIHLIEDHNEALKVWRQRKFKGLDLVHLDAHIDFGYHPAKPIEKILKETGSLKELKSGLEHSLAFMRYEKDFDKQTNLGNYIYPAMEEGIVKDFYWVIPGGLKEFKKSCQSIRDMLNSLLKINALKITAKENPGIISIKLLARKVTVCILERLPTFKENVLLDIDTDFLVIDSLLNAASTSKTGKRKPWITPQDLTKVLKKKIEKPKVITIAYSVNGGWTPIKYKHLADEIAYNFAPKEFEKRFKKNSRAAEYFRLFASTGRKQYYQKAVTLNPTYRAADNNYGPLYLLLRKFALAENEFSKILMADPKNPASLSGLGSIALEKKDFKKARKYFSSALNSPDNRLFSEIKRGSLLGLANAEFKLRNFKRAEELTARHQTLEPLQADSYYLLGRIFEEDKDYERSVTSYKDALRLGYYPIEAIRRILRISPHLREREAVIKYALTKYNRFKRSFKREEKLSLKKGKKIRGLREIEKKMASIEKILQRKV